MSTALLLEDQPLIAMDLEESLQVAGFDVVHLISCAAAIDWIGDHHADVAIVDVQLSDGTCQTVVERLQVKGIPFVVHSGDVAHQYAGTPFQHGIWLNKPSSNEELLSAVQTAMAKTG